MPPFWLDSIHPSYKNLDWGQTILGLPRIARILLKRIYPNYPLDKLIKWGEFQQLRLSAQDELKKHPKLILVPGIPTITKLKSTYGILVEDHAGVTTMEVEQSAYFYNWVRKFALHSYPGLPQRSHTELYKRTSDNLPERAVILGYGESMVWLERDFPSIVFICIKRPEDKLPQNSRYNLESIERVKLLNNTEIHLDVSKLNPLVAEVTDKKANIKYIGECFTAYGFKTDPEITAKIPKCDKQEIPTDESKDVWVAPQDMPIGGLMESYMQWIQLTNNLTWAYEPQAHHKSTFPELVRNDMNNKGIELDVDFFNKVDDNILALPTKIDDKECLEIFVRVFKEVKKASEVETSFFKEALEDLFYNKEVDSSKMKP